MYILYPTIHFHLVVDKKEKKNPTTLYAKEP